MAEKAKTTLRPRGKAFPKGNNMNPAGAPVKEMRLSTWLEKELDEVSFKAIPGDVKSNREAYENALTKRQRIARMVVDGTLSADTFQELLAGAAFIADRTEGKPRQSTDLTTNGKDLRPLTIVLSELSTGEETP